MEPLEKLGWAIAFIVGLSGALSWMFGDIPLQWRSISIVAAICIIALAILWPRMRKQSKQEEVTLEISEAKPEQWKSYEKFKAGILNKKSSYRVGDVVQFWARFAGALERGYFLAEAFAPTGTTLPNGKKSIQWLDVRSYHHPHSDSNREGRVSGTGPFDRTWSGEKIPTDFPIGEYQVTLEVWDGEFGKANRLAWKEGDSFVLESSDSERKLVVLRR